jgi:hypothetical protein
MGRSHGYVCDFNQLSTPPVYYLLYLESRKSCNYLYRICEILINFEKQKFAKN